MLWIWVVVVQLLSCVWLFVTPWTATRQDSLSITISLSSHKLIMSIESVVPSNHLIFCHPHLLPLNFVQYQSLFQWVSTSHQVAKYRSFSIGSSDEYLELISFRIDWFDLFALQGTLKTILQHHSSEVSILWRSAFLMIQLSHPYMTTGKTIGLTTHTFLSKVMSLLFNTLS